MNFALLLESDYLVQQINRKYRSAIGSYPFIASFYIRILDTLKAGIDSNQVIEEIIKTKDFNYLTLVQEKFEVTSKDFSTERKSEVFIKETLMDTKKCSICKGYIHKNSITIDHKVRKQDGGLGNADNGQLAHPYCNSTYKN